MKFRTSFQIPRPSSDDAAKEGVRPGTSRHFKMPSLLSRPSRSDLTNGTSPQKPEASSVSLTNGTRQQEADVPNGCIPNGTSRHKTHASEGDLLNDASRHKTLASDKDALSGASPQKADAPNRNPINDSSTQQSDGQKAARVNGTSAQKDAWKNTPSRKAMQDFLQKTGANLKATGAKLERRIPRRKSKVVYISMRTDLSASTYAFPRSSRPRKEIASKSEPSTWTARLSIA